MSKKNKLGQYFTTNVLLKEKLFEFILNKPTTILEPSIGQGDLIDFISNKLSSTLKFDMYEIDSKIKLIDNEKIKKEDIIYDDFMKQEINKKYMTIVGNPPFIRNKKGNLYIDFTEKCFNLLEPSGELIFIVPSDFLKLTSASKLLNQMLDEGCFTHIYHPNNESLFENASIDVIIFRYCKNPELKKTTIYNDKLKYISNSKGLITFQDEEIDNDDKSLLTFKDYFDIYVGIVSGKDEVYKNKELGNIEVLNGEDKIEKYIYLEKFPSNDQQINNHLLENKISLMERGIRKFKEDNWFEWGAPRNIKVMTSFKDKPCIYIYNLTRKVNVAFIGKVGYFGGGLIMLKPKQDIDLIKTVSYLNSDKFKENFMFSGRFKIGHRQISNSKYVK